MPIKEKKALTPEDKYKLELQTETELLRLQREYHILERDRATYGTSGSLAKQKRVINILRREYNEILTDLAVAGSGANAKLDARIADELHGLLGQHNTFAADIKREKAYLAELDTQITMAKKSIVELRAKTLTEIQCSQKIVEGQRTLGALENKLECATMRFCITLSENMKLRGEIDHLLKERAHFNKLWDRLVTNLSQGKKFMLDLIEQATIAYDQREEWCQKLQTLRSRAHLEYMAHTQEMTEMQRQIDNKNKLQEFLRVKGQKRIMKNLLGKEQKKRLRQRKEMEDLLANYTSMLEDIKDFMGDSNLHRIIEKFAEIETDNFTMFKFINELNREMEDLSDELIQLQFKIDEQKELNELRGTKQGAKLLSLEEELSRCTAEATTAEADLKSMESTLAELLDAIDKLFKLCSCSNAPLIELLGDNSQINTQNALLYMEILEQKVNEMIMAVYYDEKKAGQKGAATGTIKSRIIKEERIRHHLVLVTEMVSKDPCPLCVEQSLVSDVIDSLQKVMNKDQIAEKLEEAIEKHGFSDVVHNVSGCHLPKSRAIIQKRYQ